MPTTALAASPTDDECLDVVWRTLFSADGSLAQCPVCGDWRHFSRVRRRRAYACSACGHHVYPAAGTFLANSSLPLRTWSCAAGFVTDSGDELAVQSLAVELGVSYRTALRLRRRIQQAREEGGPDAGLVASLAALCPAAERAADAVAAPRRRRASRATRDAIRAAACQTLTERGLAGTRVADVARAAGVSPATVHYYFPKKGDVLVAGLVWAREQQQPAMDAVLRTEDHVERLRRLVDIAVASGPVRDEYALWLEFMAGAGRDPTLLIERNVVSSAWRDLIRMVMQQGVEAGVFRPRVSAEDVALRFVYLSDGLAFQAVSGPFGVSVEECREQLDGMLAEALDIPVEQLRRPAMTRRRRDGRPAAISHIGEPPAGSCERWREEAAAESLPESLAEPSGESSEEPAAGSPDVPPAASPDEPPASGPGPGV
jgi:AcrR family transcriptional regulator